MDGDFDERSAVGARAICNFPFLIRAGFNQVSGVLAHLTAVAREFPNRTLLLAGAPEESEAEGVMKELQAM